MTNASYFRRGLETRLMQIFADVNLAYKSLESRLKAEGFKMRVMAMFRAWEEWAVYPREFLIRLQNTFLGLSNTVSHNYNVILINAWQLKIILAERTKSNSPNVGN